MTTWEEFKKELKESSPESKQMVEEAEAMGRILSAIIDRRNELGLSQRDLAKMCDIPQSTVARLETFTVSPTIDTLLKILTPLGLTLTVTEL